MVELKVDPRVVEKEITKRSQKKKYHFWGRFGCLVEVFVGIFSGTVFGSQKWNARMKQEAAGCGQEAAECRQDAEESRAGQEYPLPPVQISYRNLAGYPAEKDLRRPGQPA